MVKKWAQVSLVAPPNEQRDEVDRLAEALSSFTRAEARRLVVGAKGAPLLCSYSNDGTPMTVRKRIMIQGVGGTLSREGGTSRELLCQRAMFRSRDSTGGWKTAIMIRDPVPLVHGKGAEPVFSAAVEFLRTLRQMGHWGIAVQHYAFDRALHAPLVRRFKQKHAQLAPQWVAPTGPDAGAAGLFQPALLEWIVDTPCCNHDVHNGLKWALFQWLTDEVFMKEVFIVIESLRNGFDLLVQQLDAWLLTVVSWEDADDLWDPSFALAFWSAVGCEPRWAEEFVELGLMWADGRLRVHEKNRGSEGIWARLSNCLLYSLKFTKFSDSRWCTLGRSARQLLLARLVGLDSLVAAVLGNPKASHFYIGGYKRKTGKVDRFICLAAFASIPADTLLSDLLKDDRVVLHQAEYRDHLREEMDWLQDLPIELWAIVCGLCDTGAGTIRSQVLASAHTSLGFIHERWWSEVEATVFCSPVQLPAPPTVMPQHHITSI